MEIDLLAEPLPNAEVIMTPQHTYQPDNQSSPPGRYLSHYVPNHRYEMNSTSQNRNQSLDKVNGLEILDLSQQRKRSKQLSVDRSLQYQSFDRFSRVENLVNNWNQLKQPNTNMGNSMCISELPEAQETPKKDQILTVHEEEDENLLQDESDLRHLKSVPTQRAAGKNKAPPKKGVIGTPTTSTNTTRPQTSKNMQPQPQQQQVQTPAQKSLRPTPGTGLTKGAVQPQPVRPTKQTVDDNSSKQIKTSQQLTSAALIKKRSQQDLGKIQNQQFSKGSSSRQSENNLLDGVLDPNEILSQLNRLKSQILFCYARTSDDRKPQMVTRFQSSEQLIANNLDQVINVFQMDFPS